MMIKSKYQRKGIKKWFLGCLFAFLVFTTSLFGGIPGLTGVNNVYAEPETIASGYSCKDSLGSLGWLVCPSTGKVSEAVDFLYDKIEDVLVINPIEMEDGAPIYEIWKYFQGLTNVLFILFLLVIVFSQITGIGVSNYGVKKTLPKLIVAAVLVNLSFYICSLAVDASNIFGTGLRGLFETIETSVGIESGGISGVQLSEMYSVMAGGTAASIVGAAVAFETGAIWMLIPLALGGLVSVVIGLITIAMRQAVVTVLVMISPLAMVAYILPNTDKWFKKWRELLFQMLIFYPAFSLLFGASSVAGWAIIVSSQNGFTTLIGVAVQIFPLFFSWSLMKMSGTVLGAINSKLTALTSGAMGGVQGWAISHRELSRQKHLAAPTAYTPSMRLQQFLSDRKIAREEEIKEHAETVKNRGLAYMAMRNYDKNGLPNKEAEEAYEAQARNARYKQDILRHTNNMNKGLGQLKAVNERATPAQKARLGKLDAANVVAFDSLKMEQSRGELIDYNNAKGYHGRMEDAINVHMDAVNLDKIKYRDHFESGSDLELQADARYKKLSDIMEGDVRAAQYAAATAAYAYDSQNKVHVNTMQKYFELLPPTKDVSYRLDELTKRYDVADNIDAIVAGMRVLSARGDTDLVREQVQNVLKYSGADKLGTEEDVRRAIENNYEDVGIQLGSHASQALASFLMFDVGDSDPFLRRFGKYINLETAHVYNKGLRKNARLSLEEYLKGGYEEYNPITNEVEFKTPSKDMTVLLEGTSFDKVERTAYRNLDDMLMDAYKDENGKLDLKAYLDRRKEIEKAIAPQFISASLKYLSGSEQLKSAVEFLTGYHKGKQRWEWRGENNAGNGELALSPDDAKYAREYFEERTMEYLNAQTPTQILGLRSDYKDPLLEHLSNTFRDADISDWDEEARKEYEDYIKEFAEIQTRYGDLDINEAERKRSEDRKELKNKMAGAQLRHMLDANGKLNQIYRTRRSGAANNAKDWVRAWLGLDNDAEIEMKLSKDRQKTKKALEEAKKKDPNYNAEGEDISQISSSESIKMRLDYIDNLYVSFKGESPEAFYKEIREYLVKQVGKYGYLVKIFDEYYENNKDVDMHEMAEWLKKEVGDPENY